MDEPGLEDLPSLPGRALFKTDRTEEIQVPYLKDTDMWRLLKQYKAVKQSEASNTQTKARQIEILSTLSKLDFATRRQLQAIHCLGSIRNANRVLKDLHPYCHITKWLVNTYII